MAIQGKIVERDGKLYVHYTYDEYSEPFRQNMLWRILERRREHGGMRVPEVGDAVRSERGGSWAGNGSVITGDGSTPAEIVERVPIPPPIVPRGKQLRWYDGRWEKLMARGWMPAGEGKIADASGATPRRGTEAKKTRAQLASEIDDYLKK